MKANHREWQKEFSGSISLMDMKELWLRYRDDWSQPDDYDGEFTTRHWWMCKAAEDEIEQRLFGERLLEGYED